MDSERFPLCLYRCIIEASFMSCGTRFLSHSALNNLGSFMLLGMGTSSMQASWEIPSGPGVLPLKSFLWLLKPLLGSTQY